MSGTCTRKHPRSERPWPDHRRKALVLALLMALSPGAALADPEDELARTIEQSLTGIEFRLTIAPEQAARDLEQQKRLLQMLAREAPEHVSIPDLREQVARLEEEVQARIGDADPTTGSASAADRLPSAQVPAEVDDRLRAIRDLQTEAERALLRDELPAAADRLARADEALGELERRFADDIPSGHVPLLVAKELLAALQDQVAAAQDGS